MICMRCFRVDQLFSNIKSICLPVTLLCLVGILFSCAPQLSFREIGTDSPQSAFEQLVSINHSLVEYQADGDIQITIPSGNYNIQAKVHYEQEDRWLINLTGPFGLRLANIETDGNRYIVDIRLTGSSISGYLDEPFYLESLGLELPRLDIFVNLLLPLIDINSAFYTPLSELSSVSDSVLVIEYREKDTIGQVKLKLSFNPLIVYSEERSMDGIDLYKRQFSYRSSTSYLPESVKIFHDKMSIDVSYHNIRFHDVVPENVSLDDQS